MDWLKRNGFLIALCGAVLLAFEFPELGMRDGPLKSGVVSKLGIFLIFLMQGLSLRTRLLLRGMMNLRLHLFVQSWNYLFSCLLMGVIWLFFHRLVDDSLWFGFFYLSILPTTISGAVTLSTASGGDGAGAIFNATLSNMLGVFLVPLGVTFIFSMGSGTEGVDLLAMFLKLSNLVFVPLILGQVIRPLLVDRRWFSQCQLRFKPIANSIIVFTVFAAFSESFAGGGWSGFSVGDLISVAGLVAVYLISIGGLVWFSSGWVGISGGSRIAAFYCGSQKTLAAGVPMAYALFSGTMDDRTLGLLILPLMLFHPVQLLIGSVLVPRFQLYVESHQTDPS